MRLGSELLRLLCFLACVTSIGALLAKVYGIASMQTGALVVALPCTISMVGVWAWARKLDGRVLADALRIGFVGGLVATIAYDVARLPFHLIGQRVFAPISAYGVWLLDADSSSRFSEVVGWCYHFWNGASFGIMYALYMKGRHWGWAIVWACFLETVALLSPFGRVFSLSGNYYAIGIAYLGHVAYGIPLGKLVQYWERTQAHLTAQPGWCKWVIVMVVLLAAVGPMIAPENASQDARVVKGVFRIEGRRLNPDWLRILRGQEIAVRNPEAVGARVRVKQSNVELEVAASEKKSLVFSSAGIYQVFVESQSRSRSSFVIVEPVEELR